MWLVYDSEEGVVVITDSYEEALTVYESYKEELRNFVDNEGEFTGEERVSLARIERDFYSYETQTKIPEGGYYWDWIEQSR